MRRLWLLVLFLAGMAGAQQPQKTLFETVRQQVAIVVRKHPTGADLVEITMLESGYPADLLKRQIEELGVQLKSAPRGLQLYNRSIPTDGKAMNFLKATFAIDGIIDRTKSALRIQPIVRAFAGAPEPHTIKGISIMFDGEQATSKTLRRLENDPNVELQAIAIRQPLGLEYRVKLISQDPAAITVPDSLDDSPGKNGASPQAKNGVDWTLWSLLGVAALAVGALVYFVLLRLATKQRPPTLPTR